MNSGRVVIIVVIFVLVFFFLPFLSRSQSNILLLEKQGRFKNIKYRLGDEISLRVQPGNRKLSGQIHYINDSSILVDFIHEVNIEDVTWVYSKRFFFNLMSPILLIAGGGYFILDGLNRAINHEYPVITKNTLLVSGSLIGVGLVFRPLGTKRHKIGGPWRLTVLDMSF